MQDATKRLWLILRLGGSTMCELYDMAGLLVAMLRNKIVGLNQFFDLGICHLSAMEEFIEEPHDILSLRRNTLLILGFFLRRCTAVGYQPSCVRPLVRVKGSVLFFRSGSWRVIQKPVGLALAIEVFSISV